MSEAIEFAGEARSIAIGHRSRTACRNSSFTDGGFDLTAGEGAADRVWRKLSAVCAEGEGSDGEAACGERDVRSNDDVPGADFIRNPIVGNVRTVFNDDHLDAKIARNIDALVRDDDDSEAEACGDRVDLVLHRACVTIDKDFAHFKFT